MAEAYHQAAQTDADMVAATQALERIRLSLLTERDVFKLWQRFDEAIGAADADTLRPALIGLRAWFEEQLFDQQRQRLEDLFARELELGWQEWLRVYAEGLAHWKLLCCRSLVNAPLHFPEQFRMPHDFKRATQLILHERWTEVHQFFTFLAGHEFLDAHTRAGLLIPAGRIHLYLFSRHDRALEFFQQAEQLAPGSGLALAALGEYYLNQNEFARSRTYLEQAMQAEPDIADAYVNMGDLAEKQGNLEEARNWYQEAINKAVGDSLGYRRLLRLYARPAFIERYEEHITRLADRAKAVEETGEYGIYLVVGDAYTESRRYDTGQKWYDKAIDLEPNRLNGYLSKGFAYLDEGEGRYDAAREALDAAIGVAPEAYNGYWGMGQLTERRGQWADAAEWYAKAMQRQSEFYSNLQSRIGEMQWKMGNLQKAEVTLLDALRHDHMNDMTVLDLADDYYENQSKPDEALWLFRKIREVKGSAFEAGYQNRVGNVYYYQKEYETAAQHYLNAIRSDSKQAVYFSNLSLAYRKVKRWTESREHLKKAYELHGDRHKYEGELVQVYRAQEEALEKSLPTSADGLERLEEAIASIRADLVQAQENKPFLDQLDRLEQMREFVIRYGTNALKFDPVDKPVRIHVSSDLLFFILEANQTDLSKDFLSLIQAMRVRLRLRYGVSVPGLDFTNLTGLDIPSGSYQIEVMAERVAAGRVETGEGSNPCEFLLHCTESVLSDHLDKLCGYQETANLLAECDTNDCAQIKDDLDKLMALTRRLKHILHQGGSISDLAQIAGEVNKQTTTSSSVEYQSKPKRLAQELSPDITKLILHLGVSEGANRAEWAQKSKDLQDQFFDELGVIIPQMTIVDSPLGLQLQINEEKLPIQLVHHAPDQIVATELRLRVDKFLALDTVEYYLRKLRTNFPVLVNVIRHCFSTEELTQQLRHRLSFQCSIRSLPRVLEELISAAFDGP